MLRWLVSSSLRQPLLVLAIASAMLVAGFRTLRDVPLDVFPEFAPPLVEIQTEAPGLSTEEVESLVSVPLENGLNGITGLTTLRSKSVLGLSSVVLLFERGTNLVTARQLVQERLAIEAARLPAVVRPPVMLSPLSSMSRVLKIGVWSKSLSQMELTELIRWTVRPRLMAVPGVANVAIWGQRDKQFQVLVDPERLQAHQVTLDAVVRAATEAAAIENGGFVDTPNQRLAVRHLSPIVTPQDLARTVVDYRGGSPLLLDDVAEIVIGHAAPIGDAVINDSPGLLLIVEKQPAANTLAVTRQVEAALSALRPGLHDVEMDSTIFRPATFIERALSNLMLSLFTGCVLVAVVLALFLFDWRTALISATAIPLSLVAAALVLQWVGMTMNTMVLAGLVIALGEVVDDAIIDVENVVRRLRLNSLAGMPRTRYRVLLDASLEVRSAVVYASLILVLVFLPVFYLEGLAGSFFRPLAVAYVASILASLLVALTVTPAMCMLLLSKAADRRRESPLITPLKQLYSAVLPWFVRRPRLAAGGLTIALIAAVGSLPLMGVEFLPKFQETDFLMHWVEKPGTSLEAMTRITERASRELRSIPGVRNFGSHIGRAEVADEVVGPNFTELWISLDTSVDYPTTVARIQETVDGYPGLYRDLLTYLTERIKEVGTGTSASIVVRVFGPDMQVLRAKAQEIDRSIADIPGIINRKVEPQVLVPQIDVRLKAEAAERFGLTAGQVRRAATTLIKGLKVGEVFHDQKVFDVAVWGVPGVRRDWTALEELLVQTPSGARVPLKDVAEVCIVPTPNEIKHEGASRRIDVTCNVAGRDVGSVARDIEAQVRSLPFPRGYHAEFLGDYAASVASRNRMLGLGALSLFGILVLLQAEFRSLRLVLLVMLSVPIALIGGVLGAWLGGGTISLGSLVGFVTVFGVAVRTGIMLLSHYQHLQVHEGEAFGLPLALRGAEERLAPILMTTLTTVLGLMPLIWAGHRPGNEIEFPMAQVILGGLATSTLMNLLLMPALYQAHARDESGTPDRHQMS